MNVRFGYHLTYLVTVTLLMGWNALLAQDTVRLRLKAPETDTAGFNRQVTALMAACNIPAASIAIIDNGNVVFSNAYGVKTDSDGVDKETVFEACSLSKTFLLYAVYKLVDEGRMDLDKPLFEYLENDRLKHDPRYRKITARMVMSHCSGIENWEAMNNEDTLDILSEPGQKFIYSGEGYIYLSEVVAHILNKKYETYIKEMVLDPLGLKTTYTSFSPDLKFPDNYAKGHDPFGRFIGKWRNTEPEPASGINTVASDYARLIIAIFNGKNLSAGRIRDITQPVVKLSEKDSSSFFGPGFVILRNRKDTLIYQGGDNEGWKACVVYSIVNKTGMVLMTNSDRGLVMLNRLNELSVGFDLSSLVDKLEFTKQYPNNVTSLLSTYHAKRMAGMLKEVDELIDSRKIQPHTLNELSYLIYQYNTKLAISLLHKNLQLAPSDSMSYYILGAIAYRLKDYGEARDCFKEARDRHFVDFDNNYGIDLYIDNCEKKIAALELRKLYKTDIRGNKKIRIEAEYYNKMFGIEKGASKDTDGSLEVTGVEKKGWLEYSINVHRPGKYAIRFRVTSPDENGLFSLQSGKKLLASVSTSAIKSKQGWYTVSTTTSLASGSQMLRLSIPKGNVSLNWFEFSLVR